MYFNILYAYVYVYVCVYMNIFFKIISLNLYLSSHKKKKKKKKAISPKFDLKYFILFEYCVYQFFSFIFTSLLLINFNSRYAQQFIKC